MFLNKALKSIFPHYAAKQWDKNLACGKELIKQVKSESPDIAYCKRLLREAANVHRHDYKVNVEVPQQVFYLAAEKGHLGIMKGVIEQYSDFDVNFLYENDDLEKRTPLMGAAMKGQLAVVDFLKQKNAAINTVDGSPFGKDAIQRTALDYAIDNEHTDVKQSLKEAGALTVADLKKARNESKVLFTVGITVK